MTEIDYHLYSKKPATNLSPLTRLLRNKEANDLLFFIAKGLEYGVTLKEIKSEFQSFSAYEKQLEELIEWQVIRRNDGRYLQSIPVIREDDLNKINQVTTPIVIELVALLKTLESDFYEVLTELNPIGDRRSAFYILVNGVGFQQAIQRLVTMDCEEVNYLTKKNIAYNLVAYSPNLSQFARDTTQVYGEINVEGQKFIRFNQGIRETGDIQSFLELLEEPKLLASRPELKEVYQLLGDLNPTYFLENCSSRFKRVQRKGYFKEKNRDIFTDALVELGYLNKEGVEVTSIVPIYHDKDEIITAAMEKLVSSIVALVKPYQSSIVELANECSGVFFAVPGALYLIEIYQLLFLEVSRKWQQDNQFTPTNHPNKLVLI